MNYTLKQGFLTSGIFLFILSCASYRPAGLPAAPDDSYFRNLEKNIFNETNLLRTMPEDFTVFLKSNLKYYRGNYFQKPGAVTLITNEGKTAVEEAILALQKQKSLPSLKWSDQLSQAAKKHAEYTGKKGIRGHTGENGSRIGDRAKSEGWNFFILGENISYGKSDGKEVLEQLIVDDGVPSRGHRVNILNEEYTYSGVGCAEHKKYGITCVIMYSGNPR